MQARLVVLGMIASVVVLADARDRATAPLALEAPADTPRARIAAPVPGPSMRPIRATRPALPALPALAREDEAADEDAPELDIEIDEPRDEPSLVQRQPLVPPPHPVVQGIEGRVTDAAIGEPLVGVTVIATAVSAEALAAITDEAGRYAMVTSGPGTFRLDLYYLDTAVERPAVVVNRERMTPAHHRLFTSSPDAPPILFGCGGTIENTYVIE